MNAQPKCTAGVCVIGDVHGHMQLALLMAARWQVELGAPFDAVVLCGDVGAFSAADRLDKATRRHALENPCELEMLQQWMTTPPAAWLERLFVPVAAGGLGLLCPVIMVHGNHEDFDHLGSLVDRGKPSQPVPATALPHVDPRGWISFLPSGWRARTAGGEVIAGIGGIEPGQRPKAGYPPMAYISEEAVLELAAGPAVDILITHQGPAETQGMLRGAPMLDLLLQEPVARVWLHGHSVGDDQIRQVGGTIVIPLHGVPFQTRGPRAGEPGIDAWCRVDFTQQGSTVDRRRPDFWREFDQRRWVRQRDGALVAPQLL